jgi:hypothetical protein
MGRKIAFGVILALTVLTAVAACTVLVLPRQTLADAGRWVGVFPA